MNTADNNLREAERWMKQAIADLAGARVSFEGGNYEWACFQAQQSAEKALKSLLYARGYRRIVTHSVYELLRENNELDASFEELRKASRVLDSAYIMTRYPDSIVGGLTPSEYYEQEDARECLSYAESICTKARELFNRLKKN